MFGAATPNFGGSLRKKTPPSPLSSPFPKLESITSTSLRLRPSTTTDREIQSDVTATSANTLRLVTGVDHAQTGIDRREIALRGFNNSVTGETYVLTDYRLSAAPGMAINAYGLMPIASLDMDRIEVVRGPGAALYGSGVDQGLMHFVTKSPFSYPGTSLSVGGGERSLLDVEMRHAGTLGSRFGYKIVGEYASGDDWALEADNPVDATLIAREGGTGRDPDFWKYGITGTLEYRPTSGIRIVANGGYLSQKMSLLTGIGAAQTDNFAYTFAQLRVHAGNLFAQVYMNQNDSGDSFYYGPTSLTDQLLRITDQTVLWNSQAQYTFSFLEGRQNLLVGTDFKRTSPRTAGTLHGRNEAIDQIDELGVFLQSATLATDQLDVTAAIRADYNNVDEKVRFSPRAGLVFKITPTHTFRVAANRAFGAPGLNPNFLDMNVSTLFTAASFGVSLQGRGAHEGFTFANFRDQQTVTFLLPDIGDLDNQNNPSFFGTQVALDQIPVAPVYENFASRLGNVLTTGAALPPAFANLSATDRDRFAALLNQLSPFIGGNAAGALGVPDINGDGFLPASDPTDIKPLEQSVTNTLEFGYKGLIGNRIVVATDIYFTQKRNFVGPLLLESPYVLLPGISATINGQITPFVEDFAQADPILAAVLQNMGVTAEGAAALIADLIETGFDGFDGYAASPVAIVQPDQTILSEEAANTTIGGLLTYRNFGNVTLWGVDLALEYLYSDRLRLFGNTSFVSDDFFDNTELEEEDTNLAVALNAPTFKLSMGFDYQLPRGLSFRMAGRYISEFPVRSGPFTGIVDNYAVLDAGIGYDFGRQISGLRLDVTAQNLLTVVDGKTTTRHREFVGAPQIGRLVMARLVFTF
ncbi:MAG: TonB-dependent receptor [Bacteroidota bacterium]